jgi:hypothetical protein
MRFVYLLILLYKLCDGFLIFNPILNLRINKKNLNIKLKNHNNNSSNTDRYNNRYLDDINNNINSDNNIYTNNYLSNISSKLYNFLNINHNNYLNDLNYKKPLNISNNKLIKKIDFDNLVILNDYIAAIYFTKNDDKIMIELNNESKYFYYYENNYKLINNTIINNEKITIINYDDYPYYMINTPMGIFNCEN